MSIQPVDVSKTYRLGDIEVHARRGVSLSIASGELSARRRCAGRAAEPNRGATV